MADPHFIGVLSLSPYTGPPVPYYSGPDEVPMVVDNDFGFVDSRGVTWTAHKGDVVDGANLPEFSEPFIGGSFTTTYLSAAALHDIYCRSKVRSQKDTSRMFREAMITNGVWSIKAWAMYLAVRLRGPRW